MHTTGIIMHNDLSSLWLIGLNTDYKSPPLLSTNLLKLALLKTPGLKYLNEPMTSHFLNGVMLSSGIHQISPCFVVKVQECSSGDSDE